MATEPADLPIAQLFLDTRKWDAEIKARLSSNPANDAWWIDLLRRDLERAKRLGDALEAWVEDLDDQLDLREAEVEAGTLDEGDYLEWEPRVLGLRRIINRRLRLLRAATRLLKEQQKTAYYERRDEARRANTEEAFRQQEQARAARAERLRTADEFTRKSETALRILVYELAQAIYLHREHGGPEADGVLHEVLSWSIAVAPDKEVTLEENVHWWLQREAGRVSKAETQ